MSQVQIEEDKERSAHEAKIKEALVRNARIREKARLESDEYVQPVRRRWWKRLFRLRFV